jgi:hypothetical protein
VEGIEGEQVRLSKNAREACSGWRSD